MISGMAAPDADHTTPAPLTSDYLLPDQVLDCWSPTRRERAVETTMDKCPHLKLHCNRDSSVRVEPMAV